MEQKSFLVVLRHPFFLKNFAAILNSLTERGHKVRVLFSINRASVVTGGLDEIVGAENPAISFDYFEADNSYWSRLIGHIAHIMDVFRYRNAVYDNAPSLRSRAQHKGIRGTTRTKLARGVELLAHVVGDSATIAFLRWLIEGLPVSESTKGVFAGERIDLVTVAPLTPVGSEQALILQGARRLGLRTAYTMYSWDNLTNKGLIRPRPDAGVVWNAMHVREAVDMHAMPEAAMSALGSPGYDIWFSQPQKVTAEEFRARLGLAPHRPHILYTCSSVFVGGRNELAFVERFLSRLRAHPDPAISSLGVLVRPHPQNTEQWETADLSRYGNVAVSPRGGEIPFAGSAREDYYHAILHSSCVVGINTSAMVEAAIIDRPVVVIEDPSYADRQEGTLHFQHLKYYGFLQQAAGLDAAIQVIAQLQQESSPLRGEVSARNRAFVDSYIRPSGYDQPAAPLWADEFLRQASLQAEGISLGGLPQTAFALALWPLVYILDEAPKRSENAVRSRRKKPALVHAEAIAVSTKAMKTKLPTSERPPKVKGRKGAHKVPKGDRPTAAAMKLREEGDDELAGTSIGGEEGKQQVGLEGAFPLLSSLQQAFHESERGPDVLLLGDSVHYRVSSGDSDKRTLPTMITDELRTDFAVHSLSYSAFHPAIYDAFVEAALKMRHPPRIVVMPLNLRAFSPQWAARPDYAYDDVREVLARHNPGDPPSKMARQTEFDLGGYHDTKVAFDLSSLDSVAAFSVITTAKKLPTRKLDLWRARELMIFHYTYKLTSEHKFVVAAARLSKRMKAADGKLYAYVTPVNTGFGVELIGDAFAKRIKDNVDVLRTAMVLAGGDALAFIDYSDALPPEDFFHREEKTEHLNESGRMRLTSRIAADLRTLK